MYSSRVGCGDLHGDKTGTEVTLQLVFHAQRMGAVIIVIWSYWCPSAGFVLCRHGSPCPHCPLGSSYWDLLQKCYYVTLESSLQATDTAIVINPIKVTDFSLLFSTNKNTQTFEYLYSMIISAAHINVIYHYSIFSISFPSGFRLVSLISTLYTIIPRVTFPSPNWLSSVLYWCCVAVWR